MKKCIFILAVAIAAYSCKKETLSGECSLLKAGISTGDETKVAKAVTDIINSLPSKDYTNQNFETLATRLDSECGITVIWKCFDCVQTLPSQSELYLVVDSVRGFQNTIDLSYTADNKMKFVKMH